MLFCLTAVTNLKIFKQQLKTFVINWWTLFVLLLTVNEAVCGSHQSVPQTNVPVKSKTTKLISIWTFQWKNMSLFPSDTGMQSRSENMFSHPLGWRRFLLSSPQPPHPSLVPVVCRETCCSDEGGRAHEDKVMSCLVVALQRLPKDKTKEMVSSNDSNKGAGEE